MQSIKGSFKCMAHAVSPDRRQYISPLFHTCAMLANYGLPLVNVEDMDCDCSAELRAAGIVATFGGETELVDLDNE